MILGFANFNINMKSKFEGIENHVEELGKKFSQHEHRIIFLLKESNKYDNDQTSMKNIENYWSKYEERFDL
jgi:hypothetical protein